MQKAKKLAMAAIEVARRAIVGLIKAFGAVLKAGDSSRAPVLHAEGLAARSRDDRTPSCRIRMT